MVKFSSIEIDDTTLQQLKEEAVKAKLMADVYEEAYQKALEERAYRLIASRLDRHFSQSNPAPCHFQYSDDPRDVLIIGLRVDFSYKLTVRFRFRNKSGRWGKLVYGESLETVLRIMRPIEKRKTKKSEKTDG